MNKLNEKYSEPDLGYSITPVGNFQRVCRQLLCDTENIVFLKTCPKLAKIDPFAHFRCNYIKRHDVHSFIDKKDECMRVLIHWYDLKSDPMLTIVNNDGIELPKYPLDDLTNWVQRSYEMFDNNRRYTEEYKDFLESVLKCNNY